MLVFKATQNRRPAARIHVAAEASGHTPPFRHCAFPAKAVPPRIIDTTNGMVL